MKVAMLGIYGGINRDYNPGNVLIAYYTKKELMKRREDMIIDIFSLDYSLKDEIEKKTCFSNTPFELEMTFFSNNRRLEIYKNLQDNYDMLILGGDIIIGLSETFFLDEMIKSKKHPKIVLNAVSTLWRTQLISDIQKKKIFALAEACDYVSVREHYVKELFEDCGVTKKIEIVPDPVLQHKKNEWAISQKVENLLDNIKQYNKKIVGVSDCLIKENNMVEALIKSSLIQENKVIFFSYSKRYEHSQKGEQYKRILGSHCDYILEYLNPWETYSFIENLDLCIGNAYHCCVAAFTSGVPFIGIDPSPFVESRHTEIAIQKEKISPYILKASVVDNDLSGVTLQKYMERAINKKPVDEVDLSAERKRIENHFDRICGL